MNRFARRLIAAITIVPALLLQNAGAAFAYTDPEGHGGGVTDTVLPPPSSIDPTTTTSGVWERAQWMVTGAAIAFSLLVVYVTVRALVHRHQQVGAQLRSS